MRCQSHTIKHSHTAIEAAQAIIDCNSFNIQLTAEDLASMAVQSWEKTQNPDGRNIYFVEEGDGYWFDLGTSLGIARYVHPSKIKIIPHFGLTPFCEWAVKIFGGLCRICGKSIHFETKDTWRFLNIENAFIDYKYSDEISLYDRPSPLCLECITTYQRWCHRTTKGKYYSDFEELYKQPSDRECQTLFILWTSMQLEKLAKSELKNRRSNK